MLHPYSMLFLFNANETALINNWRYWFLNVFIARRTKTKITPENFGGIE